jgi:hypothetical protein
VYNINMFTQKPIDKICAVCNTTFNTKNYRQKYCSPDCKVKRLGMSICKQCNIEFPIKAHTTGELCSSECWYKYYDIHGKITNKCPVCEKTYHGRGQTCSSACGYKYIRMKNPLRNELCKECGKSLEDKKPGRIYCSKKCASQNKNNTHLRYENGDTIKREDGYLKLKVDGKWVLEHRYAIEQSIGRKLHKEERVHHKNGNRSDNRLENLELWAIHKKDPAGSRVDDLKNDIYDKLLNSETLENLKEEDKILIKKIIFEGIK